MTLLLNNFLFGSYYANLDRPKIEKVYLLLLVCRFLKPEILKNYSLDFFRQGLPRDFL